MAVESVMRTFAADANEDVEYWGAVGLLHDVDYEKISGSALQGRAGAFEKGRV
jgi:predicted hydrolase (HD superfamily)